MHFGTLIFIKNNTQRYTMKRSTIREHVFRILFRYDFYGQEDFAEQAALYFDARVPEKIVPIMYRKGPVEKDEDDDELDCAVISDMDRADPGKSRADCRTGAGDR